MKIELIRSDEFRFHLDPVACEDRHPSVAFDIEANLETWFDRHSTRITLRERWFWYDDLNRFEDQLRRIDGESCAGTAVLATMSAETIVSVDREGDRFRLRIQGIENFGRPETVVLVEFTRPAHEIGSMLRGFSEFPKWW